MTYQPKQKKAIWWRPAPPRPIRRIRPMSQRRAKLARVYGPMAQAWKAGRGCACAGMRDGHTGRLVCHEKSHACEDVHHSRGRCGALLMDQRWWVPVCRTAHRWIGENVAQARDRGLTCPAGQWNTPVPAEAA